MQYDADTIEEYFSQLPEDRVEPMKKLWSVIQKNIPGDFTPGISYKMPGYVVSHEAYPPGYHCDPKLPLPFLSIASQKNFIAFYHMGVYANEDLYKWFVEEYPNHSKRKLDMGKSCVRFKKMDDIPYDLIGELVSRMTAEDWINLYEENIKNSGSKSK